MDKPNREKLQTMELIPDCLVRRTLELRTILALLNSSSSSTVDLANTVVILDALEFSELYKVATTDIRQVIGAALNSHPGELRLISVPRRL